VNPGADGADGEDGAPQTREERIALLADALTQGKDLGGGGIRIDFLGVNPPPCGVEEATITIEDLPGPFVEATIAVDLGSVKTGSWWNDADGAPGQTSYNDRRRNKALRAAGWRVEGNARRTLEANPGDPASVAAIVDAIQGTFEAAASVKGAPPVPPATWRIRYFTPEAAPHARPSSDTIAPDEPWLDAVTEADLRTRLVTLAGSRGGTLVVRATDVPNVQLDLEARRRGDRIEVSGHDPATSWKGSWTMSAAAPDAGVILRDLEAALAPPGGGGDTPGLSVRLEQHDEAADWSDDTLIYVWTFGGLAAAAAVSLVTLLVRPAGAETWVGILDRGLGESHDGLGLLVIVAMSSMLPAWAAGAAVSTLGARMRLRYAVAGWLSIAAAALAGVAYVLAIIALGDAWAIVAVAPWAILIGAWAVTSLRGRRSR
jgi:hypothetical protein